MDLLILIFKVIVAFILAQFIIGPILVYMSQKMPEAFRFKLLDQDDFLSERTETFKSLHETIINQGFEYIGSSEINQSHSNMYFSIYNNYELEIACTLSTAHSAAQESTQIEFTQMYSDGTVVNINNNPIINVYPKSFQKLCFRFPDVNDFGQLLDIAMKLISAHKTEAKKVTFDRGHEFPTIEDHLTDELKLLISKGWVSSKVNNEFRKLTIKGAILMTWQLCWPVKLWFISRDLSQSKRALDNA
ncbi:hypothetical protein [Marinobacter sp. SS21]|uniref:hypothetical protein n=1 Tax=Marinobacter sp. SS21 TaxID=2979460 RepID=UPI00232C1CDB|nr:hypothetical protein [Marinobacter sp. SS21]MDC0660922.1 hypothetical protein [Marinobacter sp. SS21]